MSGQTIVIVVVSMIEAKQTKFDLGSIAPHGDLAKITLFQILNILRADADASQ